MAEILAAMIFTFEFGSYAQYTSLMRVPTVVGIYFCKVHNGKLLYGSYPIDCVRVEDYYGVMHSHWMETRGTINIHLEIWPQ